MKNNSNITLLVPEAAFRIWHFRERIEIEAAFVFGKLAEHLSGIWGAEDHVATLALEAQQDELRHQQLCRAILNLSEQPYALPSLPPAPIVLGPKHLNPRQRGLYAAVAMGCVTESLSTALLLQMHKRACDGIFKDTVHAILKDEVNHARIGWAELARAQRYENIDWLSKYIPAMIHAAIADDIVPMVQNHGDERDLSAYGILLREEAKAIMNDTIQNVIAPGLKLYGITFESSMVTAQT